MKSTCGKINNFLTQAKNTQESLVKEVADLKEKLIDEQKTRFKLLTEFQDEQA